MILRYLAAKFEHAPSRKLRDALRSGALAVDLQIAKFEDVLDEVRRAAARSSAKRREILEIEREVERCKKRELDALESERGLLEAKARRLVSAQQAHVEPGELYLAPAAACDGVERVVYDV